MGPSTRSAARGRRTVAHGGEDPARAVRGPFPALNPSPAPEPPRPPMVAALCAATAQAAPRHAQARRGRPAVGGVLVTGVGAWSPQRTIPPRPRSTSSVNDLISSSSKPARRAAPSRSLRSGRSSRTTLVIHCFTSLTFSSRIGRH